MAERCPDGRFRVLGTGQAPALGIRCGDVVNAGDAVEAVVEALAGAARSSGERIDTVYFNFDDPQMEGCTVSASKQLRGEGEIRSGDIEEACGLAERMGARFDRTTVYSRPVSFLIDDRDVMSYPIGTYGQKLEVKVLLLLARSAACEAWQKVFQRAHVRKAVRVASAVSTAHGALAGPEERLHRALIVDAGGDCLNVILHENNGVTDLLVRPASNSPASQANALAKDMAARHAGIAECVVTGELAADLQRKLGQALGLPVRPAAPRAVPGFTEPSDASIAGLLHVADRQEKKALVLNRHQGLLEGAKERAKAIINEYF